MFSTIMDPKDFDRRQFPHGRQGKLTDETEVRSGSLLSASIAGVVDIDQGRPWANHLCCGFMQI
jgi:hypothetical protein